MRFNASQYLKMAALLDDKAKLSRERAHKQASLAEVFRVLARKATAQEGEPPFAPIDPPGSFEPVEVWEKVLVEVRASPDFAWKQQTILYAEHMIALKKEELLPMPSNLPSIVAMIDEPGPFGDTLSEWRQFLSEVEQLPDSIQKRHAVTRAKQMIATKLWEIGLASHFNDACASWSK